MSELIAVGPDRPMVMHRVPAAAHRDGTLFAELPMLFFHAGRDFRHVRNELGAQPHRVGCAGLARLGCALGAGAIELTEKRAGQEPQPAGKTNDPHGYSPSLETISGVAKTTAQAAVDGLQVSVSCRSVRRGV